MITNYEYMKALYCRFNSPFVREKELHGYIDQLKETLNQEQRILFLRVADEENAFCDDYALESFVRGFCLGAGIAEELRSHQYSFDEDMK